MSKPTPRLPLLAAACLLSVALPALPAVAKEKVKKPAPEAAAMEVDYSVTIPTIDAVDANVDNAVLNDIFSGNIAGNADALATLDATSITVPEIVIAISAVDDGETQDATVTITDFVLDGVADGVSSGASIGAVDLVTDEGTFTFGAMSAADLDIGGLLGVYGLVDTDGSGELKTIYTDFSAEGGSLEAEDISCTIGPVSTTEFRARPLNVSFIEFMALAEKLEAEGDAEEMDPALLGQFIKVYADLLTAFETSEMTSDGINCDGVDDEGMAISFGIDGMTIGGWTSGVYPTISMDGFMVEVENDGAISLDNLTIKETDLSPTIAALQSAPAEVDDAWFEANARSLIPSFGGFSFDGLDIDIPDPENADARIQAQVGAFDLTLADYLNGIPTSSDVSASNIRAAIPEDTGDEFLDQLRTLGVTELDAGFRLAAIWDEASESIDIEEFSVTGVDLATVTLAGTINNATADLFAMDEDAALMAAMGIAVKSLDLSIDDAGLSDIIIAAIAAEQGAEPETLRPVFAGLAQGSVIGMMAGAADAAKLGEAINAFVSGKAKSLDIGIVAKEDPGLSVEDMMAAETDPASLIGKVSVSAEAK